jgi:hypothetical protein
MTAASDRWQQLLPFIQLSLNHKELQCTGSKPFELFFGRPFNSFKDYNNTTSSLSIEDLIKQRLQHLEHLKSTVYPAITESVSNKQKNRNRKFNETHKILQTLLPGTHVMILDPTKQSKWDQSYEGPFTVSHATWNNAYILLDSNNDPLKQRFTVNQLKIIDVPSREGKENQQTEDTEESYEVENIVKHRTNHKKKNYDYLVKWKNYSKSDNSWINEDKFNSILPIKNYWKKHNSTSKSKSKSN